MIFKTTRSSRASATIRVSATHHRLRREKREGRFGVMLLMKYVTDAYSLHASLET